MKELDELRECLAQLGAGYSSLACENMEHSFAADAALIQIQAKIEAILMRIEDLISPPI